MPFRQRIDTIRFLTLDELGRLLAVTRGSVRDRALFLLAYRHGLRASEVGLLRAEDLDLRALRLTVHRLKGSFSGTHPLQPDEAEALRAWLREREQPPSPNLPRYRRAVGARHERGDAWRRLGPLARGPAAGGGQALGQPVLRGDGDATQDEAPEEQVDAPLVHLRAGPGRASVASLREELARLDGVRRLGLPGGLFAEWGPAELETCRQRVTVKAPYELRRHPEATRLAWLAAYAHRRGRTVTDALVALPAEVVHHIGARAGGRVEKELLDDLKRVGGKQGLLYRLAGAAIEDPDGSVRDVIYPAVSEQILKDLVREAKASGPTYRTTLRATIRSSYRRHCRRALLDLGTRIAAQG